MVQLAKQVGAEVLLHVISNIHCYNSLCFHCAFLPCVFVTSCSLAQLWSYQAAGGQWWVCVWTRSNWWDCLLVCDHIQLISIYVQFEAQGLKIACIACQEKYTKVYNQNNMRTDIVFLYCEWVYSVQKTKLSSRLMQCDFDPLGGDETSFPGGRLCLLSHLTI